MVSVKTKKLPQLFNRASLSALDVGSQPRCRAETVNSSERHYPQALCPLMTRLTTRKMAGTKLDYEAANETSCLIDQLGGVGLLKFQRGDGYWCLGSLRFAQHDRIRLPQRRARNNSSKPKAN